MSVIDIASDKIHDLVDVDVEPELLSDGYGFLEGLTFDGAAGVLHFVDLTNNRRLRWVAATEIVEVAADPSNMANGLTLDADGRLLVCEHTTSSLVRISPDGKREVLASHWKGKELNSPNDVVTGPDGTIYFTDPPYGRMAGFGVEREQDLDFQGFFRIPPVVSSSSRPTTSRARMASASTPTTRCSTSMTPSGR